MTRLELLLSNYVYRDRMMLALAVIAGVAVLFRETIPSTVVQLERVFPKTKWRWLLPSYDALFLLEYMAILLAIALYFVFVPGGVS